MRQIIFLFVFSCLLSFQLIGQERPQFKLPRRLTAAGYVSPVYWGDELVVRPKGYAGLSAKAATRHALAEAKCDATGTCYIPFRGDSQGVMATAAAKELASNADFEWATLSPVLKVRQAPPNDPAFLGQWALGSQLPGGIGWQPLPGAAPDNIYFVSLDTGMCEAHEDFDWSRNEAKLNFNAILAPTKPDAQPFDDNGHGCATSGLVAAKVGNGKGIVGIADFVHTGYVKVLNRKGEGDTKTIVSGILELATRVKLLPAGSRVVALMAFGSTEYVAPIEEAMQVARKAGVVFVVAAGNDGLDVSRFRQTPTTTEGAIAVGACGTQAEPIVRTYWATSYGHPILGCAPGSDLWTTVPKPLESVFYDLSDPSGYKRVEGTSFSAAIVAGMVARILAERPDATEEEIRIRLMNGRRNVQPTTIWKRTWQPEELFVSGASLYLPTALAKGSAPPLTPILEVSAGHSSARLNLNVEKPFGIRCFYGNIGDQKTYEAIPFFGQDVILRNQDGTPLPEKTSLQVACRVVDGSGQWSALSKAETFVTRESVSQTVSPNLMTPMLGPLGDLIAQVNPNVQVIWSWKDFPLLGSMAWYAGNDQLNYRVGDNDSMLESPDIALPEGSVSVTTKQFVQMIGTAPQGFHYDLTEMSVVWNENGETHEKIVRQIMPNNRSFGVESQAYDLTEFGGKTVRLRFRLFTNGSSVGIGWILAGVEVKTDK